MRAKLATGYNQLSSWKQQQICFTKMSDTSLLSRSPTDNLTSLTELTQRTLLDAIKQRYSQNLIYTDVGDILVAVNPFQRLPIYDQSWAGGFSRPELTGLVPHIYKTAARAYNALVQGRKDQVCVISGESGAGKTESAKLIMKQVMMMCKSSGVGQSLQRKITQLNPILEAFGNAKTALNDNSSRFGKFIQLIFDPHGRIVGAGLEQYLLEKSRVCVQGEQERNFHIFYYLYAGLDQTVRDQLLLKNPKEHRYLKRFPQVMEECTSAHNKKMLGVVEESMLDIGFEKEEVTEIHTILAAILLIGDIEFEGADGGDDNSVIKNPGSVEQVAQILQLDGPDELSFALTTLRTETRGEAVDKRYKCSKAADVRDALVKALYATMFHWIVTRLNSYLQPYSSKDHLNIGILDIFGFENFESNSFEQLCINLANEQLQCYFNHQIFAMEKVELLKEGLENLGDISYTDNEPVLDLFMSKPIGLLSLLDEQCRGLNGTEKAFVQSCKDRFRKHPSYIPDRGNNLQFTIQHYAGRVLYQIAGFLEKNKDPLPDMLVESVKYGKVKLVRTLFRRPANPGSDLRKSVLKKSQRKVMRAMSRKSFRMKKGGKGKPKKSLTVGGLFQQSLKQLMERIFAATPHFIRCIKPNYEKSPGLCDDSFMLTQLTYTGMLEAVRVRREGFSYRPYFSDFFNTYRCLAYHFTDTSTHGSESAVQVILQKAGLDGWQLGKSRVFLRYYHEEKLHLLLKDMEDKAVLIQKVYKGWTTRKYTGPLREKHKREKQMATQFLTLMNSRAHGKNYMDTMIELNKTDILLAKERFRNVQPKATTSAPLSSRESFKALSTEERKVRKAKQFGVQLMPGFGQISPRALRHQLNSDMAEDSDEDLESSQEEATDHSDHAYATPTTGQRSPPTFSPPPPPTSNPPSRYPRSPPSTPPPPPTTAPPPSTGLRSPPETSPPPPPTTAPPSSTGHLSPPETSPPPPPTTPPPPSTNSHSPFSTPSHQPTPPVTPRNHPVPQPRTPRKKRSTPDPDSPVPRPRSKVMSGSRISAELEGIDIKSPLTNEITDANRAGYEKHTSHLVGGVRLLPKDMNGHTSPKLRPVPKPRRPKPKRLDPVSSPASDESGGQQQEEKYVPRSAPVFHVGGSNDRINNGDFNTGANGALSSGEVSTAPRKAFRSGSAPDTRDIRTSNVSGIRSLWETGQISGNSSPTPSRGANNGLSKSASGALPGRSGHVTNHVSSAFMQGQGATTSSGSDQASMLQNLVNLRIRVNSIDKGDEAGMDRRKWSVGSNSSGSPSPSHAAPMADRRAKNMKKRQRSGSSESSFSHRASDGVPLTVAEESEDILGVYPTFNHDRALDSVNGQPQGTYVVYRDEDKTWGGSQPSMVLMMSLGRAGIQTYPILTINHKKRAAYYLGNVDKAKTKLLPSLKELLEYYRSHEVSAGVRLSQPRLLAGVLVAKKQPKSGGFFQKRLGLRKN